MDFKWSIRLFYRLKIRQVTRFPRSSRLQPRAPAAAATPVATNGRKRVIASKGEDAGRMERETREGFALSL